MKQQLREILRFLRSPGDFLEYKSQVPAEKDLLYAYANEIRILSYFLGIYVIFSVLKKWTGLEFFASFPERIKFDSTYALGVVLLLVWAPIVEEIAFRAFLNFKPLYVGASVGTMAFFTSKLFFPLLLHQSSFVYNAFYAAVFLFVGMVLATVFEKTTTRFIEKFLRPHFSILVYASIIGFGFVHITNFDLTESKQLLWTPIATLPQLLSGVFLCYIRVNHGLFYSIALHFMGNLLAVVAGLPTALEMPFLGVPVLLVIFLLVRWFWRTSDTTPEQPEH